MQKFIKTVLMVLTVLLLAGLAACMEPVETNPIAVTGVTIDKPSLVLLTDTTEKITAAIAPADASDMTFAWTSSDNNVATVTNTGDVTAVGGGIATVTVTTTDGEKTASAMVYVGDMLVSADYSAATGGFGVTTFATVSSAASAAAEGKTVVARDGNYAEALTLTKSLTLIGEGYPVLKSVDFAAEGKSLTLMGFEFKDTAYPAGGEATVMGAVDGELTIKDCTFKIESEDTHTGGYAIFVSAGTSKVTITGCTIENYRYGLYAHRAEAVYTVSGNTFKDLDIGIGVDLRVPSSNPAANYAASGSIANNAFTDVVTQAEFYYNGETYSGALNFSDFTA